MGFLHPEGESLLDLPKIDKGREELQILTRTKFYSRFTRDLIVCRRRGWSRKKKKIPKRA